jgi:hypothetical protein
LIKHSHVARLPAARSHEHRGRQPSLAGFQDVANRRPADGEPFAISVGADDIDLIAPAQAALPGI